MQLIYAALLLHSSGKKVDEEHMKKVLEAIGSHADQGQIKALVSSLDGVDIDDAIKQAAMVSAVPAVAAPVATSAAAEKKEESEEKKAEEAAAGLSSLFG